MGEAAQHITFAQLQTVWRFGINSLHDSLRDPSVESERFRPEIIIEHARIIEVSPFHGIALYSSNECSLTLRQEFPTWRVGSPRVCQTQIQGVSNSFPESNTKFEILCPATFVAQIWYFINYDEDVSDKQRLTEGYQARTTLEIPALRWYFLSLVPGRRCRYGHSRFGDICTYLVS